MHTDNQIKFQLPGWQEAGSGSDLAKYGRLIAKTFVFRLIYGGTCWAYVKDADFKDVGYNAKQWQSIIDQFYRKYPQIAKIHTKWVQDVASSGKLVMPTGREYTFQRYEKNGEMIWPRTTILNYPVQGLGADLMAIVRVLIYKYLKEAKLKAKLICTVHDSIDVDSPDSEVEEVLKIYQRAFEKTPQVFNRNFNVEFNVPFRGECSIGTNLKDLKEV